jgi:hypothetical protein
MTEKILSEEKYKLVKKGGGVGGVRLWVYTQNNIYIVEFTVISFVKGAKSTALFVIKDNRCLVPVHDRAVFSLFADL